MKKVITYNAGPMALSVHTDGDRPPGLRISALWGPMRSGKSSCAVWRAVQLARRAGKLGIAAKILFVRDTFTNLRDSTLKTFLEWFPDHSNCGYYSESKQNYYLRDKGPDGQVIEHECQFRHGGTAREASKYLSTDYAVIVAEEICPAFSSTGLVSPGIAKEVFDMFLARAIQKDIRSPEVILTFNPPTPEHWANKYVLKAKHQALKTFFFDRKENEHNLRPGYYAELESLLRGNETFIARFIRGEVVAVYPGVPIYREVFNRSVHVRPSIEYNPDRPLILLFDNPPTPACLVTQIDSRGRWLILKEFQGGYMDGKIMETIGQREFNQIIKAELAQLYPGYKLAPAWADQALKNPSNTEGSGKIPVTPAQIIMEDFPGLKVHYGAVDNFTRQTSVRQKLSTSQMGQASILFSEEGCPLLIEGMAGGYRYSVNTDGTKLVGSAPLKNEFSHVCNSLEYGCSGLFPAIKLFDLKAVSTRNLPPSFMSA